jgi:hypothetical protein
MQPFDAPHAAFIARPVIIEERAIIVNINLKDAKA